MTLSIQQLVTTEAIRELRRRTAVSSLDAMRALSASDGDVERAVMFLHTPLATVKSLQVEGSHRSARLAASLIAGGLWFECAQLGRELWRFSVAPGGFGQLQRLHAALDADGDDVTAGELVVESETAKENAEC